MRRIPVYHPLNIPVQPAVGIRPVLETCVQSSEQNYVLRAQRHTKFLVVARRTLEHIVRKDSDARHRLLPTASPRRHENKFVQTQDGALTQHYRDTYSPTYSERSDFAILAGLHSSKGNRPKMAQIGHSATLSDQHQRLCSWRLRKYRFQARHDLCCTLALDDRSPDMNKTCQRRTV